MQFSNKTYILIALIVILVLSLLIYWRVQRVREAALQIELPRVELPGIELPGIELPEIELPETEEIE